jgi:hypothetical protein
MMGRRQTKERRKTSGENVGLALRRRWSLGDSIMTEDRAQQDGFGRIGSETDSDVDKGGFDVIES